MPPRSRSPGLYVQVTPVGSFPVAEPLIVDVHEPDDIVERLVELGVAIERRKIHPGDYVLGEVGIERKALHDFFGSLIRKRLFEQLRRLRDSYPVALMILEGDLAEISEFKNPGALFGALVAVEVDERVPILTTADREQTALLLSVFWKRHGRERSAYGLRHKPKELSLAQRQQFLVEGLPNVGETLARNLLEHFGSVRAVFAAAREDLVRVPKIGETKAAEIEKALTSPYEGPQRHLEESEEEPMMPDEGDE